MKKVINKIKHFVWQVLIAYDQVFNALLGGWADETLSARAYRLQDKNKVWAWTRKGLDVLFFWEEAHCETSYYSEKNKRHFPPELR